VATCIDFEIMGKETKLLYYSWGYKIQQMYQWMRRWRKIIKVIIFKHPKSINTLI